MREDGGGETRTLRVDGGMAANDWFCQFLANMLGARVERPVELESTARGAAFLAGLSAGLWGGAADITEAWALGRAFEPDMAGDVRDRLLAGWKEALARATMRPGR
jgi:glycerol kinase